MTGKVTLTLGPQEWSGGVTQGERGVTEDLDVTRDLHGLVRHPKVGRSELTLTGP